MSQQATIEIASAATGKRHRVKRWFFINVALFMILFNIVAFAPSIIDASGRNVPLPLTPLVAAHAILSFAFLVLFLAQAALVASGRVDVHRRMGIAGAVLAAAFVVTGWVAQIEYARRGFDLSGDLAVINAIPGVSVGAGILAPLVLLVTFGILVVAALCYRHRPEVHKRLMLFAVLGGLSATPVAHVTGHWTAFHPWINLIFLVTGTAFLALPAVYDRLTSGRSHPVSLWVALAVFVAQNVFFIVIVQTAAWESIAAWMIG